MNVYNPFNSLKDYHQKAALTNATSNQINNQLTNENENTDLIRHILSHNNCYKKLPLKNKIVILNGKFQDRGNKSPKTELESQFEDSVPSNAPKDFEKSETNAKKREEFKYINALIKNDLSQFKISTPDGWEVGTTEEYENELNPGTGEILKKNLAKVSTLFKGPNGEKCIFMDLTTQSQQTTRNAGVKRNGRLPAKYKKLVFTKKRNEKHVMRNLDEEIIKCCKPSIEKYLKAHRSKEPQEKSIKEIIRARFAIFSNSSDT